MCQDSRNTAKTQRVGTPSENDVQREFLHAVMDDIFLMGYWPLKRLRMHAVMHDLVLMGYLPLKRFSMQSCTICFNGLLAIKKIKHTVMHGLF